MLSRENAIAMLEAAGDGALWTQHCFAVADKAVVIGAALEQHQPLDIRLLWSAALLHDVGRQATQDPVRHGVAGYHLLTATGHAKEARVCASHVLFGLRAAEAVRFGLPDRDFIPESVEEKLVALVDLLIEFDQPTSLTQRFASLRKRNAGNAFFLQRLDRAFAAAEAFKTQIEQILDDSVEGMVAKS